MTDPAAGDGELVAVDPFAPDYHPTFTGNGFFAARVPAAGQGYARTPIETQFQVAGLFGVKDGFQVRAGAPAWTTLRLSDDGGSFSDAFEPAGAGAVSDYRQALDLSTGVITTSARWVSPGGDAYAVTYRVLTDRADEYRGLVRLDVVPEQDGQLAVTDVLDARAATLVGRFVSTEDADSATVTLESQLPGTGLSSVFASTLRGPAGASATPVAAPDGDSIGQGLRVAVRAGESVSFVKYVGIAVGTTGTEGLVERARGRSHRRRHGSRRRRGGQSARVAGALARRHPYRRRRAPAAAGARQPVLPAGQRPRRPALVALAGRAVVRRLRRARLLGHRDLDVALAAPRRS